MSGKNKKKNAATKQRQTRDRQTRALYPHYVPCPLEEAEREVGAQRAAELMAIDEGELSRATVELDKLLHSSFVFANDPGAGRVWTLEEYRTDFNSDLAEHPLDPDEEPEVLDQAQVVTMFHDYHQTGELLVTRDLTLKWT